MGNVSLSAVYEFPFSLSSALQFGWNEGESWNQYSGNFKSFVGILSNFLSTSGTCGDSCIVETWAYHVHFRRRNCNGSGTHGVIE